MKTQLLSTLTQQKPWILLFLILLSIKEGNAGNAFRNCLAFRTNDTTTYNYLLNYPFNSKNGESLYFCCGDSVCPNCCKECNSEQANFGCLKILNRIYCSIGIPSNCKGMIDNILSDAFLFPNNCFNISSAKNYVNSVIPEGLDQGYAYVDCPDTVNCKGCNWDNGGWFCEDQLSKCIESWRAPWPGSADKNPFITNPTSTSSRYSTSTNTQTSQLPTPTVTSVPVNHLVEKIAIPVGTITVASLVSSLTYYYCKKKKKRATSTDDNLQLEAKSSSHRNDLSSLPFIQKIEFEGFNQNQTNQLRVCTPSLIPAPNLTFDSRTQLINQLRNKLIGHEQLWNDYLEVNNWLINNPQSQIASRGFSQLQNQLLQILTIGEIELLKQTPLQITPQTEEYFGITENYSEAAQNPQGQYFETRNPQEDSSYHYQFEVRDPQWNNDAVSH